MIYIFGAGHGAAEILEDTQFLLGNKVIYDNVKLVEDTPNNDSVMTTADALKQITKNDFGVISAWSPVWKKKLDESFNITWISAVSPGAKILQETIGLNARYGSFVCKSVKVGRHVRVNYKASIMQDCEVGNYAFLAVGADMLGSSRLGNFSILYSHAVILPGVTVGNNTIIGAGSVVTKDIPNNVIAYGNPCKVIRENK